MDLDEAVQELIEELGGPIALHELAYQLRKRGVDVPIDELVCALDALTGDGRVGMTHFASPTVARRLEAAAAKYRKDQTVSNHTNDEHAVESARIGEVQR